MTELKPCPVCGDAWIYVSDGSYTSGYESFGYKVECRCKGSFMAMSWKPTNADRIRSMSNEELALWICGVYDIEEENGKFINGAIIPGYTPNDIEEWLQKPAEETER